MITTKAVAVDLGYDWDLRDGIGEPFVVHRLRASVDGAPAGYVKLAYVPRAAQEATIPDPLHLTLRERGYRQLSDRLLAEAPERWATDDLADLLRAFGRYLRLPADAPRERILAEWGRVRAQITEDARGRFEDYVEAHVDRPRVDFIRVFRAGDRVDSRSDDDVRAERDHRRLGVATALYETAARWMDANGMRVWASGLQQPEAAAAWERMAQRGLVGSIVRSDGQVRRYINPNALDAPDTAAA